MEVGIHKRYINTILQEVATERGIHHTELSDGWIIRLEKERQVHYVFGYQFDLNSSVFMKIAQNKHAVSEILQLNQIPHVEHRRFPLKRRVNDSLSTEWWHEAWQYAIDHGFRIVCKPNDGSGGRNVLSVNSPHQLERALVDALCAEQTICLSPRYDVAHEYRAVVLMGNCELVYEKIQPKILGNGTSTVIELISSDVLQGRLSLSNAARAVEMYKHILDLTLPEYTVLPTTWKHNLVEGASPEIVTNERLLDEVVDLALAASVALNANFVAIDIISAGGEKLVLEANSGIVMEYFIELLEDGYERAKAIYGKAVDSMFDVL